MKHRIKNIAIIGLGLIGGSLAKAFKGKGYILIGIDTNSKTIKLALKEKVIHKGFTKITSKTLKNVDIIFICTPLHLIKDYLNKISKLKLKKGVIITDTGSTKNEICNYVRRCTHSPSLQLFIGGHPMAGTEKAGFAASNKDLFKDCIWVLTPDKRNNHTLTKLKEIIRKTGAKTIITTPEKHDHAVALISHLPLLASISLCDTVQSSKTRDLASQLASSGFRDTTRIASGNAEMNSNLLTSNKTLLKKLLPAYIQELNNILKMADKRPEHLYKRLNNASKWRNSLYNSKGKNII